MEKDSWSSEHRSLHPTPIFPFVLTGLVSYIMSIHIAAQQGEIADKILLPGDPLRAKFIAGEFP